MARKKEPPKPMFGLRHDFMDSLENVCQQSLMLLQAVDMVLKNGGLPKPVAAVLQERHDAMRAALMTED